MGPGYLGKEHCCTTNKVGANYLVLQCRDMGESSGNSALEQSTRHALEKHFTLQYRGAGE